MTLVELIEDLQRRLAEGEREVSITVADPDLGRGRPAGTRVGDAIHRPLRVWVELADRLELRLRTPRPAAPGRVELVFERIEAPEPVAPADPTEKYGLDSPYAEIDKLEDPGFVLDFADALDRCALGPQPRVLDLGCNRGDVLALVLRHHPTASLWGVDHSASALGAARERLPDHHFVEADVATLPSLDLPRFDLVLALNILQSPGVDDRELLRHLVQERLADRGAVILGIPNCRYRGGELLHGARMKNFTQPELSLMVKGAAHYRRYLQQHKRKVWVTGRNYILVTGASI